MCIRDRYQVFETSDIPAGSINILTTKTNELNETLSHHENVHGIWAFSGDAKVRSSIIHGTVFNLKRYWCPKNTNIDWSNTSEYFLNEFLYEGSQVKNICCLLYTSPSPRDATLSRMPSSA